MTDTDTTLLEPDTEALKRGDVLPEPKPEVEHPDAEKVAADLTAELDDDKEEKPEKDDKKREARIPESRHKAILEKEREKRADLERQLAKYQQGGQIADMNAELTAAENSILTMEKEHTRLLSDGEIDKAAALMQKIRHTERQITEYKGDLKIQAAEIRATERVRFNTALERVEAAFPTLNPDHESFDADLSDEVVDLMEAYKLKGYTPTVSLQKAVKALVEPRTTKQELATTVAPKVSDKDVAAERKTAAVGKTRDAVAKTPPRMGAVGVDSEKMGAVLDARSIMNLSQKDFAKIDADTLARLRGDEL